MGSLKEFMQFCKVTNGPAETFLSYIQLRKSSFEAHNLETSLLEEMPYWDQASKVFLGHIIMSLMIQSQNDLENKSLRRFQVQNISSIWDIEHARNPGCLVRFKNGYESSLLLHEPNP